MPTAALPAEILDPESADPSEPGPSTRLAPPPEENNAGPDDRRGDVDDLPRAG